MNSQPIPDSLRPLFDSCRSDFELDEPEMLPLRTWVNESKQHQESLTMMRRMDDQIREALDEVSIPEGLRESVLGAVDATGPSNGTEWVGAEIALAARGDRVTVPVRTKFLLAQRWPIGASRRSTWLAWGAVAATISAALLLVVAWGGFPTSSPSTPSAQDLCLASIAWIQQAETSPWTNHNGPNADELPFIPKQICRKQIQTHFGQTDCYLMSLSNGTRVYQFAFRVDRSMGLPDRIPELPGSPTQGFVCAAYQQGDVVFVIAVEGNSNDYRRAFEHGFPVAGASQFHHRSLVLV